MENCVMGSAQATEGKGSGNYGLELGAVANSLAPPRARNAGHQLGSTSADHQSENGGPEAEQLQSTSSYYSKI
ncbi:hypothetical protein SAY86_022946 [Trapa natans]|uniref:Uncharacterized protein n=1 Tax=Trapa natans TaxID=22666 RepID=A0AAN7R9Q8_TRANT|nr:hypothetical protein SAY86_022946 [Trapa natans]